MRGRRVQHSRPPRRLNLLLHTGDCSRVSAACHPPRPISSTGPLRPWESEARPQASRNDLPCERGAVTLAGLSLCDRDDRRDLAAAVLAVPRYRGYLLIGALCGVGARFGQNAEGAAVPFAFRLCDDPCGLWMGISCGIGHPDTALGSPLVKSFHSAPSENREVDNTSPQRKQEL